MPTILVSNLPDRVLYRHAIHNRTNLAFKNAVSTVGGTPGAPEVSVREGTIVFIGLWSKHAEARLGGLNPRSVTFEDGLKFYKAPLG